MQLLLQKGVNVTFPIVRTKINLPEIRYEVKEGAFVGIFEGIKLGQKEGTFVVGVEEGSWEGTLEGSNVGLLLGMNDGELVVGPLEGIDVVGGLVNGDVEGFVVVGYVLG